MANAASLGRAVLELDTDTSKLKKGLDDAHTDAVARTKKIGESMQKVGAGMSLAITAPFVMFAKGAIEGASNTEESLNKVRVVFGDTAADIEAFARDAAKNMGMSNQAALEAAGTMGNLFKGMGLSKTATRDMSKDVLQLAADLGSFNNVPTAEVLDNIRSGLVGEAEPMRKFGVLINEAAVKAEAMVLGLGGVGRELTEQEKVQARFSLIMKGTTAAQGDFARTADGLANSQKTAAGTMADASAELGKVLLPLMLEGTKIVKGLVEGFMKLSPEVRNTILVVVGVIAVLGPVIGLVGTLVTMLPMLGAAFALLTGPIGLVVLAVTLLALVWTTNLFDIQGKTKVAVDFLLNVFDEFKLLLLNIWKGIVTGVAGAINGVIGVINGFISAYNGVAEKLGLPIIGKIELITPNLDRVNAAINQVAADRTSRIFVATIMTGGGGQGHSVVSHQHGTPFVEETGLAFLHRGEAVIPAGLNATLREMSGFIPRGPQVFAVKEPGADRIQVPPPSLSAREGNAGGHGHDIVMDGRVVARAVGARTVRGTALAGAYMG